jgi:hypothetical protein
MLTPPLTLEIEVSAAGWFSKDDVSVMFYLFQIIVSSLSRSMRSGEAQ